MFSKEEWELVELALNKFVVLEKSKKYKNMFNRINSKHRIINAECLLEKVRKM